MVTHRRLAQLWRRLPLTVHQLAFALGIYVLGTTTTGLLVPSGTVVAVWWPAAAASVIAVLLLESERRPSMVALIAIAVTASGVSTGRAWDVATMFGVAAACEAWIVAGMLSWQRSDPRALHGVRDVVTMVIATLTGVIVAGVLTGSLLAMMGADGLAVGAAVATAHASAILMLLPVVMRTSNEACEASQREMIMQWVLLIIVTVAVFGPEQRLPLVFLIFPVLLWPAMRAPVRIVAGQLLTMATFGVALSLRGWGPYALVDATPIDSVNTLIAVLQALIATSAMVALLVAVSVAQRRATMADVQRRERRFRTSFEDALIGQMLVRATNDGAYIVELNAVAARLLGADAASLIGTPWLENLPPEVQRPLDHALDAVVTGQLEGWHGELQFDDERWVELVISPGVGGEPARAWCTVQMLDVTQRRAAHERVRQLALYDDLTGLANRILLHDRLEHALAESRRDNQPMCVFFLDLDGMKPVNDTYGHEAGDDVLRAVAASMRRVVRDGDTVARVGGDEFVIICPGLGITDEVELLTERLRAAVRTPIPHNDASITVDVSVGIAIGDGDDDAHELLRRADAAMYTEKRARRAAGEASARLDSAR